MTLPPAGERLLDAAQRCVARRGVRGTTLADVASEAGCSRATAYRAFPGGRAELFAALGERELRRFVDGVCAPLPGSGSGSVEDALVTVLVGAARGLQEHAALQHVFRNEPDVLLPYLGFKQIDRLFAAISQLAGPRLAPFVGEEQAGWAAEWLTRTVLSYVFFAPATGPGLDDPELARRLAHRFLVPALDPAARRADGAAGLRTDPPAPTRPTP